MKAPRPDSSSLGDLLRRGGLIALLLGVLGALLLTGSAGSGWWWRRLETGTT